MRIVVCWLLFVASPAWAARTVKYEEAMEAAKDHNPQVVQAQALLEQSEQDTSAALGVFDPVLTLSGGYNTGTSSQVFDNFQTLFFSKNEGWNANMQVSAQAPTGTSAVFTSGISRRFSQFSDFQTYGDIAFDPSLFFSDGPTDLLIPVFRLALSQELLRGVRLAYNLRTVRQARERRVLSELDAETARQEALAGTARAYWNWVYLSRLAQIAKQSVAVAEEDFRIGRARVERGQAAPVESTRLEAALVQAQTTAIESEQNAARAADALLLSMGQDPGEEIEPGTAPGSVPPLDIDVDEAVHVALTESPAIAAAKARVEAADKAERDARHQTWPSLTANVSGTYTGSITQGIDGLGFSDYLRPSIDVGGTLTVPLIGRANRAQLHRAGTEVERLTQSLQTAAGQLRADVVAQVRVLETARTKVDLADVNVRLARETQSAEEALYEVGRGLLKDVLEARTSVARAEGEAVRARTDYRVALVELDRIMGRLGR